MNIRLQVSIAIMTGVLVIIITTAVVVAMGRSKSNAESLDGPSQPLPTLLLPGSPTPLPTTPSPTPSTSKKPVTTPLLAALMCESSQLALDATMHCTVSLKSAAPSNVTIALEASAGNIQLPATTSITAKSYFSEPFLIKGTGVGGPTTLTARLGGSRATTQVTVN